MFISSIFRWIKSKFSNSSLSWEEFQQIEKDAGLELTSEEEQFYFKDLNWHIQRITEDLKDVDVEGVEPDADPLNNE